MIASSGPLRVVRSLSALLFGTGLIFVAQGLLYLLVPLQLNQAGYSSTAISLVASAYFGGFIIGAFYCDRFIRSVGHVRAYGGFIAVVIASLLAMPLLWDAYSWGVLRFIQGIAVSGTFLAIESWLNQVSPNKWRGRILSIYVIVYLMALAIGQFLIEFDENLRVEPFLIGGLLLAVSIVPVILSRIPTPDIEQFSEPVSLDILKHSPLGAFTSFVSGVNSGAFWALAPLFAVAIGFELADVSILMAVAIIGGLVLQWPLGYLTDRFDRRTTIAIVTFAGMLASFAVIPAVDYSRFAMLAVIFLYGGVMFSLYPISVSHAADFLPANESTLSLSRGLLLANGVGLALGPILGGMAYRFIGPDGLFLFAGTAIGSVAVFATWRMTRRPSPPLGLQGPYVAVLDSTPAILPLDPRVEDVGIESETPPGAAPAP